MASLASASQSSASASQIFFGLDLDLSLVVSGLGHGLVSHFGGLIDIPGNQQKLAYHIITCKFPITSLQCQHIITFYDI